MSENPVIDTRPNNGILSPGGDVVHSAVGGASRGKVEFKQPRFGLTPGKLWAAFLHRWLFALTAGLILASIGAGVAGLTYKPKYTAVASMRMIPNKPRILPGAMADESTSLAREADFQKTQAQLIKSRDVLAVVLKKDDVRGLLTLQKLESPQAWLEKELQAAFIPGTDIFRIYLTGENAEEITTIVNAVQSVYKTQFVLAAENDHAHRLDTVIKVIEKAEAKIRAKRQDLKELADLHKTSDTKVLTLRQTQVLDRYGKFESESYVLESELRQSDAMISVLSQKLKNAENEKPSAVALEEFMAAHPSVQKEQGEVTRIEARIKEYSQTATTDSPRLRQYQDELKEAQAQLAKVKLKMQPDVMKRVQSAMHRQTTVDLEQAQVKRNVQQQQLNVVEKKAQELRQEVAKMVMGSFQIENLRNEIEDTESTLKQLRVVKDHLEIEALNTRKTIEGELPAIVPTVNQASMVRIVSLYSFAGLILGLLAVSFFEARLHRIHHSADVAQELGIPTLGVLPLMVKAPLNGYARELPSEQSLSEIMFADAVNSLCARLLCDDRLARNAVIMVTSASESEGKTLLSTQLAIGLAQSGRRTLLLDGDFRKPRCHQQLGLPDAPGLNEVLSGEIALEDALKDVPKSDAKFITSGQSNPQVIKSLSNGSFANLLQRLRKDFDLIIIDSAPTLLVSDGLLLGKLADAAIMVIRSKVSKGPAVFSAFEQLSALKIPTLGAIVNATPGRTWSRYYIR